jgi:hypothetical protein
MRKEVLILTALVLSIFAFGGLVRAPPPSATVTSTAPTTATVSVNEFISLTLLNIPVNFGSMNPGDVNRYDTNPLTARIGAETNVPLVHIFTRANDANFYTVWGDHSFPVSNMQWSIDSGFSPITNYSTTNAEVTTGTAGHDYPIYHRMHVPLAQAQGYYTVGITITATN